MAGSWGRKEREAKSRPQSERASALSACKKKKGTNHTPRHTHPQPLLLLRRRRFPTPKQKQNALIHPRGSLWVRVGRKGASDPCIALHFLALCVCVRAAAERGCEPPILAYGKFGAPPDPSRNSSSCGRYVSPEFCPLSQLKSSLFKLKRAEQKPEWIFFFFEWREKSISFLCLISHFFFDFRGWRGQEERELRI